jgi:hypothetical protein
MTDQPNPAAPPPPDSEPTALDGAPTDAVPVDAASQPAAPADAAPQSASPTAPDISEPAAAAPVPAWSAPYAPPTATPATSDPAGSAWIEPIMPAVEPADGSAPAEAVTRDGGTIAGAAASRRPGARWAIAIGGIVVVIIAAVAILALAGGRPTPSIALGYMPNDTVVYGEYRLDLPGDQRQKLAAYLANYPGFKDQAAIEPKLNEAFDRIVGLASNHSQTFTTDIQPWFGGQVAIGMGTPDMTSLTGASDPASMGSVNLGTFVITITDRAKATAWIQKTIGANGSPSDYGGATLLGGGRYSAAVTDKVLIVGNEASVKAAIDTKGQGNFGNDADFKAAFSSVSRDYVGFSYTAYRAYITAAVNLAGPAAGLDKTTIDDQLLELVPAWSSNVIRFESDSIVSDSAFPSIDIGFEAKNHASTLVGNVPPTTLFYAESHDIGAATKAFLDKLRAIPELSPVFSQIDASAGLIGGIDGLIGWWGDTALAIGRTADGSIGGALLIHPTDAAAAKKMFETIRSFVVLGGGQAGITMRDEKHGDATVTIVDFGAALQRSGGVPPGVKTEIAWTVTDDVVAVGYPAAYVNAVLDAGPGPSLADDERFKSLVARVGADNLGLTFVDIQGIRALVEPLVKPLVPADDWAYYEKEILPYVSHVDAVISSSRADGNVNRLPMAITAK